MVIDETAQAARRSDGQRAHGTAIAASSGHGFATSGNDRSVVMFAPKTFKALDRIRRRGCRRCPTTRFEPRVHLNGDAHSSAVIDPAGS